MKMLRIFSHLAESLNKFHSHILLTASTFVTVVAQAFFVFSSSGDSVVFSHHMSLFQLFDQFFK